MGHHTAEISAKDQVIEAIHRHIAVNSWMNIVDFSVWTVGCAANHDSMRAAAEQNASGAIRYLHGFDAGNAHVAAEIASHFVTLGTQACTGSGPILFAFKSAL